MCGKSETRQQLQTTSTNVYFLPLPGEQDLIFAFDLKQDKKSAIKISRPWRETLEVLFRPSITDNISDFGVYIFMKRSIETKKFLITF